MHTDPVIIVGAGIGGLVTALSLHASGIPCEVYESVPHIKPLGVGINLLPHATRELDALGALDVLVAQSVQPTTLRYFTRRGQQIWSEARGLAAGYHWPQLSIHRGTLQMTLLDLVRERIGAAHIHTGHHLHAFAADATGVHAQFSAGRNGRIIANQRGSCLVAADGIHSTVRAHFYPDEGLPRWNGALLWRGTTTTAPVFDGRTMVWAGHPDLKFVGYPIRDHADGTQLFNFIAEFRTHDHVLTEREDWNQPGVLSDFIDRFADWHFDWLDVPTLIRAAPGTYRFPMVDRDPLPNWSFGRVTLLGDAAHPMYPIGSNGASQAILDARVLAGCLRCSPDNVAQALAHYDDIRRPATANVVLANRGFGPEMPMKLVEERAPDGFTHIDDVISPAEIALVTERYRATAGFAVAELNHGVSLADQVTLPPQPPRQV
jgi:2-polyprenyl-6-methoxyphenol hydroxylase-like FAD-dependent oxidoreductase